MLIHQDTRTQLGYRGLKQWPVHILPTWKEQQKLPRSRNAGTFEANHSYPKNVGKEFWLIQDLAKDIQRRDFRMFLVGFNHHFGFNTHEKTRVSSCFLKHGFRKISCRFSRKKNMKKQQKTTSPRWLWAPSVCTAVGFSVSDRCHRPWRDSKVSSERWRVAA